MPRGFVIALAALWAVLGLIAGMSPVVEEGSRRHGWQIIGWVFVAVAVLTMVAALRRTEPDPGMGHRPGR
jgi:hypothetical protein